MKNKKAMKVMTLILASSLVIVGGAGTLGLTMAKAQQETITKEVRSEADSVEDGTEIGEGVTLKESQADSEVKESGETSNEVKLNQTTEKASEEKDAQETEDEKSNQKSNSQANRLEKQGESGEEEKIEYEQSQKSWKGFDIKFISFGTKQKKGDLEITDALEKAIKYVKEDSGKTITGGKVEIQLTEGMGDLVVEDSVAAIYYSDEYAFAREYQITFNPGKDDEIGVTMNAVTGEIYGGYPYDDAKEEKQ